MAFPVTCTARCSTGAGVAAIDRERSESARRKERTSRLPPLFAVSCDARSFTGNSTAVVAVAVAADATDRERSGGIQGSGKIMFGLVTDHPTRGNPGPLTATDKAEAHPQPRSLGKWPQRRGSPPSLKVYMGWYLRWLWRLSGSFKLRQHQATSSGSAINISQK
jgi:hypothetical protein